MTNCAHWVGCFPASRRPRSELRHPLSGVGGSLGVAELSVPARTRAERVHLNPHRSCRRAQAAVHLRMRSAERHPPRTARRADRPGFLGERRLGRCISSGGVLPRPGQASPGTSCPAHTYAGRTGGSTHHSWASREDIQPTENRVSTRHIAGHLMGHLNERHLDRLSGGSAQGWTAVGLSAARTTRRACSTSSPVSCATDA
jgi:hypothetical protein